MDILSNLRPAKGSHKKVKRIGRGEGSGHGGTATRGENGQRSRSGAKFRAWFEGGQMPLQRRVPKRGFHSPFRVEYQVVNLSTLQKLVDDKKITDGVINAVSLYKGGAISKAAAPFKILGNGELKAKLNVEAHKFSASAKEKIESIGGTIKEING
ncbi:MAG: 50S ribosomal protein L15 [Ignavibacteria bacterium]|nr:MAG: 50S ribosomal protein L15 [Ignavibacteria bacterium]KAF0157255.1 MAG: 50S ribosomal protein L15 [Ignavibacteria bacterium]